MRAYYFCVNPRFSGDSEGGRSAHNRPSVGNTISGGYVAPTVTATDLTMYSTTWCGYCRRLKKQLDEAGITYEVIDIEEHPDAAEFVGSVNNGNHVVPTVKYRDGSTATNPTLVQVKQALAAIG